MRWMVKVQVNVETALFRSADLALIKQIARNTLNNKEAHVVTSARHARQVVCRG